MFCRLPRLFAFVLTFPLLICGLAADVRADQVTVFAAASLKEALDEAAQNFDEIANIPIVVSYAGSSTLARQIVAGAPADIFISANVAWMDHLSDQGLIQPETRFDLAGNTLVLIGSSDKPEVIFLENDADLDQVLGAGPLAMALVEAVPAGIYGKQALKHLGLWDAVNGKVAQTDNVRAALALVRLRAAPFGIVYATDALAEPHVQIKARFPSDSHAPVVYPTAATATARTPDAQAFLDYLQSTAAQDIFRKYGFSVPIEK